MALLHATSWYGDLNVANHGEHTSTTGNIATSTTTGVRSGERAALQIASLGGVKKAIGHRFLTTNTVSGRDYWHTFSLYVVTRPSADSTIWAQTAVVVTAGDIRIELKSTGVLEFVDSAVVIFTSAVLALNTHYVIQVRSRRHATTPDAGMDQYEAWIDGVSLGAASTNRSISTWNSFTLGGNMLGGETSAVGEWYISGYTINDDQGSYNVRPPITQRVTYLLPTGTGFRDEPTPNTGANWQCVDDASPDDETTFADFNLNSTNWTTAGSRLLMVCENGADAGIGSADTIHAVGIGWIWANEVASSTTIVPGVRSGGSDVDMQAGISQATSPFVYAVWQGSASNCTYTYLDPTDSNPWTTSKLDAAEFGARGQDTAPNFHLTALWVIVVHTEVASVTGGGSSLLLQGVGR